MHVLRCCNRTTGSTLRVLEEWQYEVGDYAPAASLNQTTLRIVTSVFGSDTKGNRRGIEQPRARVLLTGALHRGEPLYRRAIEIGEQIFGRDHPGNATGYNNLALLLREEGKYAEAEPLVRRRSRSTKRLWARIIPTLPSDIAALPFCSGTRAGMPGPEPLYQRAIEYRRKSFGQGSSQRCARLQQSSHFASGPG